MKWIWNKYFNFCIFFLFFLFLFFSPKKYQNLFILHWFWADVWNRVFFFFCQSLFLLKFIFFHLFYFLFFFFPLQCHDYLAGQMWCSLESVPLLRCFSPFFSSCLFYIRAHPWKQVYFSSHSFTVLEKRNIITKILLKKEEEKWKKKKTHHISQPFMNIWCEIPSGNDCNLKQITQYGHICSAEMAWNLDLFTVTCVSRVISYTAYKGPLIVKTNINNHYL